MRLIFMGTPQFSVPTLQALLNSTHEIAAVYTQPPRPAHRGQKETFSPVHLLAQSHGIPVYTPSSLKEAAEQKTFADLHADVAVVAAYGLLLPQAILEAPKHGCINVHPSRLPRWRGAAPIQRTILAGDTETSLCIMQMEAGLDTGDILMQQDYLLAAGTTSGELHDLLAHEAGALVLKTLSQLENGTALRTPQSSEGVTYAKKISKEEALIDFHQPCSVVLAHIHGMNPAPGAYFTHQEERIKIWTAALSPMKDDAPCGTILRNPFRIVGGDGSILPLILQREGKKPLPVTEFVKGFTF